MKKFTKYYVVEKVSYRKNNQTDRINFRPFDGIIEFATKEVALAQLQKLFELYVSKSWGTNLKWERDGFSFNIDTERRYDLQVIAI